MKIRVRRGTAAQWAASNPVLSSGEPGWDTTNRQLRVGDGSSTWSSLPVAGRTNDTTWRASDSGLVGWSHDPALCASSTILGTAGKMYGARIVVPAYTSAISSMLVAVTTAGSSLTSGQCLGALYNPAGTLIGTTADMSTEWASTGTKTMTLTAASAGSLTSPAAGIYFAGIWANGSTLPTMLRGAGVIACNAGMTDATARWATADTGLTTTAPATLGATTALFWALWAALA